MKREAGRTSRKAEVPSTVFMYVMAAVIIALILLFGYKTIGKLMETTSVTEIAKFKVDLRNIITEDTSYGKNDFIKIRIPSGYEELCFIAAETSDVLEGTKVVERYPQARDIAESSDNVFLGSSKGKIDSFKVNAFEIDETNPDLEGGTAAFCIRQQSGELKFRIQGKGDVARIVPAD